MRFVANFKTNHTRNSTRIYLEELNNEIKNTKTSNILVFPPLTALQEGLGKIDIGVQNAYPTKKGAFTGEVGLEQLEEFKIDKILIGHSERREILKESQELIAKKFEFFKKNNFEIIYCIGEPLSIRKKGKEELFNYLFSQFIGIDTSYSRLTIAYEPIWAIGTGVSAKKEDIKEVHDKLKEKYNLPLLYGGSVKINNIKEIALINSVDGVLVGSASLNANSFAKLIKEGLGV